MSESSDDLEEILALIDGSNRPLAYFKLLRLQEHSSGNPGSILALVDRCGCLVSRLVDDISVEDEEIAALALKCLGFMIFYPTIVAAIPGNVAGEVLTSIANVARTTKMKLVCNLGMWCISMQQFDEKVLSGYFLLLVKAVVQAIDNPFGSLSTTFEAFQAVMKLADQTSQRMRESSDLWLPPIYRRLLSNDKRTRDMADRCLLKIKPTVIPPTPMLFKAVRLDLKNTLLVKMKEMLKDVYKIQAVQAWGWFICLLGNYSTKDRHVFNDMLKVLESTFLDSDPQVQIASQIAWHGLIEAVIPPLLTVKGKDMEKQGETQVNRLLRIIKLIMTPIVGIVSSQCDLAVRSACFDSWCILLHKLDTLVNHQAVRIIVLKPVFKVVFRKKAESMRNGSWDSCLDILDDSILPMEGMKKSQTRHDVLFESLKQGDIAFGKSTWRQYPIKWLPLDHSRLEFYLEVIGMLMEVPEARVIKGCRSVECDAAALRILRSLLQVIRMDLKSPSAKYDDILASVKSILSFAKHISEDKPINETCHKVLIFVQAISEELEPSFLESPIYKVTLDVKYTDHLNSVKEARHAEKLPVHCFSLGDMVCPMVYLVILYFSVLFQPNQSIRGVKFMEEDILKFVRIILSSDGLSENLAIVITFLYGHLDFASLKLWKAVALGLRDELDSRNSSSSARLVSAIQSTMVHFLTYPVHALFCCTSNVDSHEDAPVEFLPSVRKDLDLNNIGEVWVSLYASIIKAELQNSTGNTCSDQLCSTLINFLQMNATRIMPAESNSDLAIDCLSLFGIMLTNVLELILTREVSADGRLMQSGSVLHVMRRFLELLMVDAAAECPNLEELTARMLDSLGCLAQRINSKLDILSFIEIFSDPFALWLARTESSPSNRILQKLERLSIEALRCSTRSQPPIEFNSSLLKAQARLLEQTLQHSKQSIRDPAVGLWNSTYGERTELDYPKTLLPILDGLWRSGRIYLGNVQGMCAVSTTTSNRTSKRVELVEREPEPEPEPEPSTKELRRCGSLVRGKRKWSELTEHQKEVRRAQQGRAMDCGGHGPGLRTYTMMDFSQGNEDSQEAHEDESQQSEEEPNKKFHLKTN